MPLREFHPTGIELVLTVNRLLDSKRSDQISTDEVLTESGISKGSLYHHFEDLQDLVETTLIYRYAKWIDLSIKRMSELLNTAKTAEDLKKSLFEITYASQGTMYLVMTLEFAAICLGCFRNRNCCGT